MILSFSLSEFSAASTDLFIDSLVRFEPIAWIDELASQSDSLIVDSFLNELPRAFLAWSRATLSCFSIESVMYTLFASTFGSILKFSKHYIFKVFVKGILTWLKVWKRLRKQKGG